MPTLRMKAQMGNRVAEFKVTVDVEPPSVNDEGEIDHVFAGHTYVRDHTTAKLLAAERTTCSDLIADDDDISVPSLKLRESTLLLREALAVKDPPMQKDMATAIKTVLDELTRFQEGHIACGEWHDLEVEVTDHD